VNAATAQAIWLLAAGLLLALVLGIVLARIISRRVAVPIGSLAAATGAVARGAATEIGGETRIDELRRLAAGMRTAAEAGAERQAIIEREKEALQAADRAKDEWRSTPSASSSRRPGSW